LMMVLGPFPVLGGHIDRAHHSRPASRPAFA
jgi:hypothetical protein